MKILGAELAAAIAERERVSTAMRALQRRVTEQEREVKGLRAELKEAREMAAATATAAEASVAHSRQVRAQRRGVLAIGGGGDGVATTLFCVTSACVRV